MSDTRLGSISDVAPATPATEPADVIRPPQRYASVSIGAVIERPWVRTVRRGWWIALLIVATAIATAFVLTARQTPLYRSSATIAVKPSPALSAPDDIIRSLDTLERRTIITTLARIVSTNEVIDRAAVAARMSVPDARKHDISGTVLPNTNLLRINVEGEDAQRVADLANAAAVTLGAAASKMYRVYELDVVGTAMPPKQPFFPDPLRNYVVALVAGLVVAAGALFLLHRMGDRLLSGGTHVTS